MRDHRIADWGQAIRAETTGFFLDVDGTLLDFKDRPEDVVADKELVDLLRRLRDAAGGALALISGRMVSDLDRIVSPLILPVAGVHGADIRFADGCRKTFEGDALSEVRERADAFVAEHAGLRLEDKGGATFAVHFRQAPERAGEVAAFLDELIAGKPLMVQHGKMVAEVKPEGCHKGIAIRELMEMTPFFGRAPLFIGDDLTDEYGFAAVNELGGTSIKVGSGETETVARHRLADTTAVRDLLGVICRSAGEEK